MLHKRLCRSAGAAILAAATAVLPAAVAAQSERPTGVVDRQALRIDFEADRTGSRPAAFSTGLTGGGGPVAWVIAEDATAPAGPKILTETSKDQTSNRFPLALLNGFSAKNVDVSVRFKAVEGKVDQAAGIVLRARDRDNYYIARANALEGNVRLYKVVNGRRQQFAGKDAKVQRGQWLTLGFMAEGNRFAVLLDGAVLFTAKDDTFGSAGQVGLWTKADSVTHFDELTVRALP